MWSLLLCLAAAVAVSHGAGAGAARLVCYVENARATESFSECTHLVYAGNARGEKLDALLKEYRKSNPKIKIILRIAEVDKDLRSLLKSKHVQGLEISDAHSSLNRTKVTEVVESARAAISASGGGPLFLSLPAHPELLAKYYDLRVLVKKVDLMMVETHDLGHETKMTYHPSRLSGMWDMMNTDSVVDLVIGLGVPASKVVISLPATARQFTLVNETLSTPGSPAVDDEPKVVDQQELCRILRKGRWTAERDQDLSAPYAFKDKTWIAFEDSSSVDVKGKYARVRGLAGLALRDADSDVETACGPTLKQALAKVLNQQSRAPRAAVLRSLEQEILSAPGHVLSALQVSPYRISQVVDSDGVIHSIREDTRTEFSCSRQGYFVHPRSCARFYRCVKFDQLSSEYTVFEFDCPTGLAFDSRYEVCVWPGSLADTQACPGTSEIAPVPQTRFKCPPQEGYYADPENCRWFFACVDHGVAELAAYEFRCPFGLGFDAARLACEWAWLVPACARLARYEARAHGFHGAVLTGASGFGGQTADAVNVAGHASLASGATLHNLVGMQTGLLTQADQLDANFIASQELNNAANNEYQISNNNQANGVANNPYQQVTSVEANGGLVGGDGLVQVTNYNEPKYTSGSLILDDYRLPTKKVSVGHANAHANLGVYQNGVNNQNSFNNQKFVDLGYNSQTVNGAIQESRQSNGNYADQSGAYVHDPTGDYAEPYKHVDSPAVQYIHDNSAYKQSSDYYDYGRYSAQNDYDGKYDDSNSGQYNHDNSGAYVSSKTEYKNDNSGYYNGDYSGSYISDNAGKYEAGVYRADGHIGGVKSVAVNNQNNGAYSSANTGNYFSDSKAYTGASHTLTAGAVNVGLVGKTTLVDAGYTNQANYGAYLQSSNNGIRQDYSGIDNNYDNSGSYVHDNSGAYVSGSHVDSQEQKNNNVYNEQYQSQLANNAYYAGQVSNAGYNGANNYQVGSHSQYSHGTVHKHQSAQAPLVAQPAVSINHVGTDSHNLDGYSFVTNPTSSIVPTTTPFASTTAIPTVTYKTTFVPEAPKTSIKQIFGISQPALTYVTPTVIPIKQYVTPSINVSTYKQENNNHYENKDYAASNSYAYSQSGQSSVVKSESSGYDYSKPSIQFEEGVQFTTPSPIVVSTFKPQGFSHNTQTVHNVAVNGYEHSGLAPVTEEPFKKVVAYTTGPSVTSYVQPTVSTYVPQIVSQQTLHKVESNIENEGYSYQKPTVFVNEPQIAVQYTTPAPALVQPVVSTQQPHVFSQQTLHTVDTSKVHSYSQQSGYDYPKPQVKFEEVPKTTIQYITPAPATYSQQTSHKIESQGYVPVSSTPLPTVELTYQQPAVSVYENPILKYAEKSVPITYVQPTTAVYTQTYKPVVQQHHVSHISHPVQYEAQSYNTHNVHSNEGYSYSQPEIQRDSVQGNAYSDASAVSHQIYHQANNYAHNQVSSTPSTVAYEEHRVDTVSPNIQTYKVPEYIPSVTKYQQTYVPQIQQQVVGNSNAYSDASLVSHQTFHHNTNSQSNTGKAVFVSTTPANVAFQEHYVEYDQPKKVETYKAQEYISPKTEYPQVYNEVPLHQVQQEIALNAKAYSDASLVSHQVYHHNTKSQSGSGPTVFVSTTPANLAYEEHYSEYEQPKNIETYKTQENIPYKTENQEAYYEVPTQQVVKNANAFSDASLVSHQVYHHNTKSQAYPGQNVFVSTTPANLAYEEHYGEYEQDKKIETYKAPEYVPPRNDVYVVSSTASTPTVQQENVYQHLEHHNYNTNNQAQQYESQNSGSAQQVLLSTSYVEQPKKIVESYHVSSYPSSTVRTEYNNVAYQSPEIQVGYKAEEYLPPVVYTSQPEVTSTYKPPTYSTTVREYLAPVPKPTYTPEYLPPKVEKEYLPPSTTAKEYLPPKIEKEFLIPSTTPVYLPPSTTREYLPPSTSREYLPPSTTSREYLPPPTTGRSKVKSTTQAPVYIESTTNYKAPEYLPPNEDDESHIVHYESYGLKNIQKDTKNKYNVYQEYVNEVPAVVSSTNIIPKRKQNIVIETAKNNLLGFGTVGPDAGLVKTVSYTSTPNPYGSSESYSLEPKRVITTYAPIEQEVVEVTPALIPRRRTKPKVAVVTKINDYNPLLVRKLGAVCSCQSPVVILKGRRPIQTQEDFDYYNNDYGRGDIGHEEYIYRPARIRSRVNTVTAAPIVSSTFNPIIVPDDSYYQDYEEVEAHQNKEVYSESFVSSTPVAVSTTEKVVRIRPRVKAVTVAPTYKTVLLNKEVAQADTVDTQSVTIESQTFDRYGPGGLRSRAETLQGSVDCKRAGLFRHPTQCNKFYACRWDSSKERFTLHVFNCPVQLTFDTSIGACNWPSQGPACQGNTLLTNTL